jgi:hypothetical protein
MNAESFTALLRSKVAEKSYGKVRFLTSMNVSGEQLDPAEEFPNADYYLTGEFIAQSMKGESLVLVDGIYYVASDVVQHNPNVSIDTGSGVSAGTPSGVAHSTNLVPIAEEKEVANVTKKLNVMLVDPETKEAVIEKLVTVDRKAKSGLGNVNLVLTGEIAALSKAAGGDRSSYVLMSFQLIDPDGNEVIWEDAYETKRVSNRSAVYK